MGYKRIGETMSFADIALSKSMENNRAIKMLERTNKAIKWRNIEALLLEYYDVGKSKEGVENLISIDIFWKIDRQFFWKLLF